MGPYRFHRYAVFICSYCILRLHVFINMKVIADSPEELLWAGIGDALSKECEVELASRGKALFHTPLVGTKAATAWEDADPSIREQFHQAINNLQKQEKQLKSLEKERAAISYALAKDNILLSKIGY